MNKIFMETKFQIKTFNWKLFVTLICLSLIPIVYTTVRIYFIGNLPSSDAFSIAAQIAWLNIFFEILYESILIPLFFLISKTKNNSELTSQKIRVSFLISFIIYLTISIIFYFTIEYIAKYFIIDNALYNESISYIRIEIWSLFLLSIFNLLSLIYIIFKKSLYLNIFLFFQLFLTILTDLFFISEFSFSLKLSINGIAYGNILVYSILNILMIIFLYKINNHLFSNWRNNSFYWLKDYIKIGFICCIESLTRNLFYSFMVLKMINDVSNSGDYWLANNFIWGWLLIPITALSTYIKATYDPKINLGKQIYIYFIIISIVVIIWLCTIPTYPLFIAKVFNTNNSIAITEIVNTLLGFYIVFSISQIFSSIFINRGRVDMIFYKTMLTNLLVYVPFFILQITKSLITSLLSITLMFGLTLLVGGVLTYLLFIIDERYHDKLNFFKIDIDRKIKNET